TIHETLKDFHRFEMVKKKLSEKDLVELYEKSFLDEGYESKEHRDERFKSGKIALKKYHSHFEELFGKPWKLEHSFRIDLGGVPLVGMIDRIDDVGDGYEIVDYKTGSVKKRNQVDRDDQLSIYALAAREALGIEVKKLSLYFIESNEKVETTRDENMLEQVREQLANIIKQIKESDFQARPGSPFPCGFCEYKHICPFAVRG
ncbi:RecB family exonuclease, partial [Pseudomonadota bacterium]